MVDDRRDFKARGGPRSKPKGDGNTALTPSMVCISVAEMDLHYESPKCLPVRHQYSNEQDATALLHEENFAQLSRNLRYFISECSKENTKLMDPIKAESDSAKTLTSTEHARTRGQFERQIDEVHRIQESRSSRRFPNI